MPTFFYLTPMLGGPGAPRYPVLEEPQLVGRSERADIPLFEPTVSRQHACVQLLEGNIELKDLGSKHGTYVNSKRVTKIRLKVGDIVVFGLSLVLRVEESPESVPSPKPLSLGERRDEFGTLDPSLTAIRSAPPARGPAARRVRTTESMAAAKRLSAREIQESRVQLLAKLGVHTLATLPQLLAHLGFVAEQIKDQQSQVKESLQTCSSFLTALAEVAGGVSPLYLEHASLTDMVHRATSMVHAEYTVRRLELLVDVDPSVRVRADVPLLTSALVEILRAVGQVSSPGGLIEIIGSATTAGASVSVQYQGDGFPPAALELLSDPVAIPQQEGDDLRLGLGLLLAEHLLQSMGTSLSFCSSTGGDGSIQIPFTE